MRVSQWIASTGRRLPRRLGIALATEDQFKSLLDGWKADKNSTPEVETPLAWLEQRPGRRSSRGSVFDTKDSETGFYWVNNPGTEANRAGPVEEPYCRGICVDDTDLFMYEYLHRYDFKDTSTPAPDAWTRSLGDLDPSNYNANAELAPKPVAEGEYFWPVGGDVPE